MPARTAFAWCDGAGIAFARSGARKTILEYARTRCQIQRTHCLEGTAQRCWHDCFGLSVWWYAAYPILGARIMFPSGVWRHLQGWLVCLGAYPVDCP